jgi:hypothetical protein
MEPREPGYSIFKGAKPEPKIVYELPDGTTTIWLSEYIDAMVQAEQDRIVKLLEDSLDDDVETDAMHYQNLGIQIAIKLIKEER